MAASWCLLGMVPHPPGGQGDDSRPRDIRDMDPVLLDRYLAGQASPEERAVVDALSAAHPGVGDAIERLRGLIAGAADVPRYSETDLKARAKAIRGAAERTSRRPVRISTGVWWARWAAVAAAACITI